MGWLARRLGHPVLPSLVRRIRRRQARRTEGGESWLTRHPPRPPEQRAEWRRLAEAATEGKWFIVRYGDGDSYVIHSDDERRIFFPPSPIGFSASPGSLGDPAQIKADMKFVAAARTAVPALLDEVERLEEIRAAAQDVLDFDGGNRSKCYHAAKAFDARERLFALSAALNPEGPSHDH